MRLLAILLFVLCFTGCHTLHVTYPPPMRRHVQPMLKAAHIAVLKPKIETETGKVFMEDFFPGQRHEVAGYDAVVARSLASALELSGVAERAEAIEVPAQDALAWLETPESKKFTHVVLAEIHDWDGQSGPQIITLVNPLTIVGLVTGAPLIFGHAETSCTMNVQLVDLASRDTVMMLSPSAHYASNFNWMSLWFTQGSNLEDHLTEFTRRLMNSTREEFESRAILLSADGTVVPYTGHNFSIGARRGTTTNVADQKR